MISIKLVALMRMIVITLIVIIRRLPILHYIWFAPHLMAMLVSIAILLTFIFIVRIVLRSIIVLNVSVP